MGFSIGLPLVIVVVAVILLSKLVRIVPQGYEWTVERWGKYTHTLTPGFHLLIPVMQNVGRKINMMEQVLDVPSQDVITKDNAVVKVDGVVFYQVLDAAKAAYEVAQLEVAIINLIMTNIRTVLGGLDLDESLSKRDEINAKLLRVVDEATHPWGLKVTRIELKDIQPPRDLVDSMARQMKAEREKRANILDAEGFRQAAILKAEGEKQSVILAAEGQKEAAFREAEARERLAAAEAKATEVVSAAIAGGDVNALNYFVANKYIEALKAMADSPNQKMLLLPIEATGVLGSLAGIATRTCAAARATSGSALIRHPHRRRPLHGQPRQQLRLVVARTRADRRRDARARLLPFVDRYRRRPDGRADLGIPGVAGDRAGDPVRPARDRGLRRLLEVHPSACRAAR